MEGPALPLFLSNLSLPLLPSLFPLPSSPPSPPPHPPFADSSFSCYSNRAASPASEPHWRHVHCRVHLSPVLAPPNPGECPHPPMSSPLLWSQLVPPRSLTISKPVSALL